MGNNLKFYSSVCTTLEQSQRLLELGLKPETADCTWAIINGEPVLFTGQTKIDCSKITINGNKMEKKEIIHYPAWSLHRLIVLYKDVEDISLWSLELVNYNRLIQCIGLAIKHDVFNKEYLKQ